MTDEEYQLTQAQLNIAVGMIRALPLDEFLDRLSEAESVGPILDPTLYRESIKHAESVHRIAEAALKLQRVANEEEKKHALPLDERS